MISYRIGFSECEHGRASNGQHVRKRLFSRSHPACQEQNSDQFGVRVGEKIRPTLSRRASAAQPGQAAPRTGYDTKTDILKRML
jgi:hypothetical protein